MKAASGPVGMIGIFDSGLGGLSILREVRAALPSSDITYLGDTAHVPYGGRSEDEIVRLSECCLGVLQHYRPDLVVVACNTATSVAIDRLRSQHPTLPIVGIVPVLKTAAERTKSDAIAVLATSATFRSASYKLLKAKFAADLRVEELPLPDWVMVVERGTLDDPSLLRSVEDVAKRIQASGADVVVLGCTHFPFLRSVLGPRLPGVTILDSGPAVARQVVRVLTANRTLPDGAGKGTTTYLCSGNPEAFSRVASLFLGEPVTATRQ